MRVGVEPASVRRRRRAHVLALVALLLLQMVPGDADALGPNWDAQARPDAQERSVRSRKLDLDGTGGMEVKLKDFLKGVPWAAAPASAEGNGTVTDVPVVSVVSPGNVTSQAGSLEMNETLFASIRDCGDLPVASLRDCIASIFEGSPYSNLTNVLDFILDAAFLNDTEGGGGDSFRIDEAQDQDQVQAAGDGAAVPQGSSGSAATIAVTVTVTTVVLAAIGAVGLAIALRRRKEGSGGASPAAGALVHQGSASKIGLDLNMSGEDVELDEVVGRGAFGVVYRATWRGRQVAVKSIAPGHPGEKHLRAFRKEVEVLSKLDHENIVVMFGACCSPSPGGGVFLVEEFVSRGSLHDRIHAREDKMETEEIVRLGLEIARALAYLHPRIVHCDLKPQNILLDEKGSAKVADFGIAKFKQSTYLQTTKTHVHGTPAYMAPELFSAGHVSEKCDVYALGMILWECLTGQEPWREMEFPVQVVMAVSVEKRRPELPEGCPEFLKRMITKCWHEDLHRRPSCQEIVKECMLYFSEGFELRKR